MSSSDGQKWTLPLAHPEAVSNDCPCCPGSALAATDVRKPRRRGKHSSISASQSVWYTTSTNWRIKTKWPSQKTQKRFWQKSAPIYDENSPESHHRGTLPQHNKGRIWQSQSYHHSQLWKTESISPKIRNKTRMSTRIQHSLGRWSTSEIKREMQIRTTMRFNLIPGNW